MIDRNDPLWYKDAVIYQLHVKAFFDANNDGIGDFAGLTQKLDYLQELGVTALWLLPFYPSPLHDDGYDIADYRNIHASYGSMRDFRNFVRECHRRGMRVITELVINHTSDQHRWFQRARRAKPGSTHRNYYVWSDTDQAYKDTRIIFLDSESSNWAWDPVAKAYYWHRFYSHQPDLNFDNPKLLQEIISVLHFWLEMGVDGLRLDAVPYLVEREGTNNENLPETHAVLKKIRAEVDRHFPDRMLLAEANQWPEDVQEYFGNGDECHMAFHFPVMPRIYMAIAQEDRHPITDIMRQTPEIPSDCQWAIFLRNHDELTLEMVTDQERDYLWEVYAREQRARINLGIRRRLAPLMDNDRRKIELMNSLLLSLPGTPIVYYGDEIGMGDNIFLGDRDGVRTPMQWSPDRNGGFSRADPARIYLPPIMDPTYGFASVNVEAQAASQSSLLNWMRRMIAARKGRHIFGRGTLSFLYPDNRKILAYLRQHENDTVLCVVNLSRLAQSVQLDLSAFRGRVPVELLGRSYFSQIGDSFYPLTLPPYSFFWFLLEDAAVLGVRVTEPERPDYITLVTRGGWHDLLSERQRRDLETDILPTYAAKQRWFAGKDHKIESARIAGTLELAGDAETFVLMQLEVTLDRSRRQTYLVPLGMAWDKDALGPAAPFRTCGLASVRRGSKLGLLYDASGTTDFTVALIDAMRSGRDDPALRFSTTPLLGEMPPIDDSMEVRRIGVEQSNSSAFIEDQMMLKLYRRLVPGRHPEVEVSRFLAEVGYRNTPPLLGSAERMDGEEPIALALLQGFVRNQGDGWTYTTDYLARELEEQLLGITNPADVVEELTRHDYYIGLAATLGRRTAELHHAFATATSDPAFSSKPVTREDMVDWRAAALTQAERAFSTVEKLLPSLAEDVREDALSLLERLRECLDCIDALTTVEPEAVKTRLHGDYHLGQVLLAQNDWYIIDFEGEPEKPLAERRAKHLPLRDVAGMVRSFNYAAWSTVMKLVAPGRPEEISRMRSFADDWERRAVNAFLQTYRSAIEGCPSYPRDEAVADHLLDLFVLEKACYEILYEAANRPAWIGIPIRGVIAILDRYSGQNDVPD